MLTTRKKIRHGKIWSHFTVKWISDLLEFFFRRRARFIFSTASRLNSATLRSNQSPNYNNIHILIIAFIVANWPAAAAPAEDEADSSCSCPSPPSSDDARSAPERPRHRDRCPPTSAAVPDGRMLPPPEPSCTAQDATDGVSASPRKTRPDTSGASAF